MYIKLVINDYYDKWLTEFNKKLNKPNFQIKDSANAIEEKIITSTKRVKINTITRKLKFS